jgi:hypothetical protein
MRERDYVKATVAYHDKLNPLAWQDDRMRTEVRYKLLQIAKIFVDYLEISDFKVVDVVLTGSMANYNWTKFSDFDIHVVTRYSDLKCDDIVGAFYKAKKQIWNNEHDITIRGHEAELYVEDVKNSPHSGGVYSILHGHWLKEPNYDPPKIDDRSVNTKVAHLLHEIDDAIASAKTSEDFKRIKDKIVKMRQTGLEKAGEFSVENLAFKVLRNLGYVDKLVTAYHQHQDQELSLKEITL